MLPDGARAEIEGAAARDSPYVGRFPLPGQQTWTPDGVYTSRGDDLRAEAYQMGLERANPAGGRGSGARKLVASALCQERKFSIAA